MSPATTDLDIEEDPWIGHGKERRWRREKTAAVSGAEREPLRLRKVLAAGGGHGSYFDYFLRTAPP